jgi:ATP/maltotriose-dependent transcriptional regulator MalT
MVAYFERNAREAVRILEDSPVVFFHDNNFSGPREFLEGQTLLMAGDVTKARSKFEVAEDVLAKEAIKDDVTHNDTQAANTAFLGEEAKALEFMKRFDEDNKDLPLRDSQSAEMRAEVYAALGKPQEAVDALDFLVNKSRWESPASVKLNPMWDSLRGDSRFRKLSGEAP